jgi:hypothetical protein
MLAEWLEPIKKLMNQERSLISHALKISPLAIGAELQ